MRFFRKFAPPTACALEPTCVFAANVPVTNVRLRHVHGKFDPDQYAGLGTALTCVDRTTSQTFFENSPPGHRIPGAVGEIASIGVEAHGRVETYAKVLLFRPVEPTSVRHTLDDPA